MLQTPHADAVYEVVEIERPFHVRLLAGTIVDPVGAPVSGVEVTDSNGGFDHVVTSTTSDQAGKFSFPRDGRPIHYLSFRAKGFNPVRIIVQLHTFAHARLRVKLPVGG